MPLTDTAIKAAKATSAERPTKMYDRDGLLMLAHPDGRKSWRFKYRLPGSSTKEKPNGIEKGLALGMYPDVSLAAARLAASEARLNLSRGVDPIAKKKALREAGIQAAAPSAANTFEPLAREWHLQWLTGKNASHATKVLRRLELYLFPSLGRKGIDKIGAPELLKAIKRAEKDGGAETAHRTLTIFGQVFSYAVLTGRAIRERDITTDVRNGIAAAKEKHLAAITDPSEIGQLLRACDSYDGLVSTKIALQLAAYVFVRPGELRQAEWSEFNLDKATWDISAERMKTKIAHHVPLAKQAVRLLRELHTHTGRGRLLFPSPRSSERPMSDGTIVAALRRMGFTGEQMSAHGFRAMARTVLDQDLRERVEVIEMQLAHKVRDIHGKAYNRTSFMPERRAMMQKWADWLDGVAVAG